MAIKFIYTNNAWNTANVANNCSIFRGSFVTTKSASFFRRFFAEYQIEPLDRFTAVIVAFSINYAAYFAEIFRGGIQSIPKGQYEAGACLGFTKDKHSLKSFYRLLNVFASNVK